MQRIVSDARLAFFIYMPNMPQTSPTNDEPITATERREYCSICPTRGVCVEICPIVEAILPKKTTGRHKKEIIVSANYAESLGVQRAFRLRYGKNYDIFKHETDENGGYI